MPERIRREYLIELVEGRRWRELRAATSVGERLPESCLQGPRWIEAKCRAGGYHPVRWEDEKSGLVGNYRRGGSG